MDIQTIEMDHRIARVHYRDYMGKCRAHRAAREVERAKRAAELGKEMRRIQIEKSRLEKEDIELLRANKALCKAGTRLIHLPTVIQAAGLTEKEKLPKLAAAPADARSVAFHTTYPRFTVSGSVVPWTQRDVEVPRWPTEITDTEWRKRNSFPLQATALVPTVPPNLRPDDLSKYHILWEAEWQARAPVDPMLLSKVNTHMYAIVASWDLTPLEQRVLEGRL